MAALVTAMPCNFYLVKNHKIADNSATTEAREKISTYLESLEFYNFFDAYLKTYLWGKSAENPFSYCPNRYTFLASYYIRLYYFNAFRYFVSMPSVASAKNQI